MGSPRYISRSILVCPEISVSSSLQECLCWLIISYENVKSTSRNSGGIGRGRNRSLFLWLFITDQRMIPKLRIYWICSYMKIKFEVSWCDCRFLGCDKKYVLSVFYPNLTFSDNQKSGLREDRILPEPERIPGLCWLIYPFFALWGWSFWRSLCLVVSASFLWIKLSDWLIQSRHFGFDIHLDRCVV
jgi:hypothetical protein